MSGVMRYVFVLSAAFVCGSVFADRITTCLDGSGWTLDGAPVMVPHTWNAEDGADGLGGNYHNSAASTTYVHRVGVYAHALPDARKGRRYFVKFAGAGIRTVVKVNGVEIGRHVGAYAAFCHEATRAMRPSSNILEVVVDNYITGSEPPYSGDFTVWGGLYRSVWLIETPEICIDPTRWASGGVTLHPDAKTGRVTADIAVSGAPDEKRTWMFPEPELWSPENPKLYSVTVRLASGDEVTERFGFRTVELKDDGFYLNGVKRKLRGVNLHQDRDGKGGAVSDADRIEAVSLIRRMGADAVRTAHYPHADSMYSLLDEAGLLVWVELPNVGVLPDSPAYRENALQQAREMVAQLRNHPCIFGWSLFNEVCLDKTPSGYQTTEAYAESLLSSLRDEVRRLDPSRPVLGAAWEKPHRRINAVPDGLGVNAYPGWYVLDAKSMKASLDDFLSVTPRRSVAISEYGAGASTIHHAPVDRRVPPGGDFHPEEYQAWVHRWNYPALRDDPRVWGSFVWVMFDFGADCRREGARHGINDKGLVTYDYKVPKDAFYFYQANWTTWPTLRLVGARGMSVTNETVSVMGFCNTARPVELALNGRTVGRMTPDDAMTVLWPDVRLDAGRNTVRLSSNGLVSEAVWIRETR